MPTIVQRYRLILAACPALFALVALASDDDEIVEGPLVAKAPQRVQAMIATDFDRLVFQNSNAAVAQQQLRHQAQLQIEEVDRVCKLTESQKQKLELAARGDLARFLEPIEALRQKYNAARMDPNAYSEMMKEIRPLQTRIARGVTGAGSLLSKTIPQVLTSEQQERYQSVIDQRHRVRYQASISVAMHMIEASVGLKHEQRKALTEKLLKLPTPPVFGQYDHYLIMYRLAGMPKDIKPLFDDRQWKLLQQQFERYQGMRQFLIEQGMLTREELEATPAARQEAGT
jgi:hypothetical protein